MAQLAGRSADFQDEVVLVTGGGRGIGAATAELVSAAGARVAVCARTAAEVQAVAERLSASGGGQVVPIQMDVTDEDSVRAGVEQVLAAFGRISVLINNAGTMLLKPFVETTTQEWDRVIAINLRGTYLCTSHVLPSMLEAKRGVIVNVGSIWGTRGGPRRAPYIASKFAVVGFTKALAEELKPLGIRVNIVNPGPVATRMTREMAPGADLSGWMSPAQIAEVLAYVASPRASALVGATVDAFGFGTPVGQ